MKLKKDIESAKETLRLGKKGDFWEILKEGIKDSIKHLEKELDSSELEDLPSEEYKVESRILRAKIKYLKWMLRLPDEIMAEITDPNAGGDNEDDDPDPY